ncbi:hypothetical protein BG000_000350 [Podila horticola]|nr:hypothetical protein BG000_000350 [Podila horticola]
MFKRLAVVSTLLAAVLASCDRSTAVSMPYDINLYGQSDCLGPNFGFTYSDGSGKHYDTGYKYCSIDYPTVGFVSVLIGTKCHIRLYDGANNIVRDWPARDNYYFEYGNIPGACRIEAWC